MNDLKTPEVEKDEISLEKRIDKKRQEINDLQIKLRVIEAQIKERIVLIERLSTKAKSTALLAIRIFSEILLILFGILLHINNYCKSIEPIAIILRKIFFFFFNFKIAKGLICSICIFCFEVHQANIAGRLSLPRGCICILSRIQVFP